MKEDQKYGLMITIINRAPTVLADGRIRPSDDVISDIKKEYAACIKIIEE